MVSEEEFLRAYNARKTGGASGSFDPEPSILDKLDLAVQTGFPLYGQVRRDPGILRTQAQGLTYGTGDEIEAGVSALGALFTDEDVSDAYDRNLRNIRGSLAETRKERPYESIGSEFVAGMLAPGGNLIKGSKALGNTGNFLLRSSGNAAIDAGVSGFASGEGGLEERTSQAARSGLLGAALGPAAQGAMNKLGGARGLIDDFATGSEMKSLGLGRRAIGKSVRKNKDLTKALIARGDNVPLVDAARDAKLSGILKPGQEVSERIQALGVNKVQAAKEIDEAVQVVDSVLGGQVQIGDDDFTNTFKYLSKLPEDTPEFRRAAENIREYLEPLKRNINQDGTVSKVLDQKRKLYGIGYLSDSPHVKELEKALARDLKQFSERQVQTAVELGAVPESVAKQFASGNGRYGQYEALQNAYVDDIATEYSKDVVEDVVSQIRTSGGAGTIILGSKIGDPDKIGLEDLATAGLLRLGRTEGGQDLISQGFKGAGALADAGAVVGGPIARRGRSGLAAGQLLDYEEPGDEQPRLSEQEFLRQFLDAKKKVETEPMSRKKTRNFDEQVEREAIDELLGGQVTDGLLDAVRQVESGGGKYLESPAGAEGPYQLMPATGRRIHKKLGIKEPYDPYDEEQSRRIARYHLEDGLKRFGSLELALADYNAGHTNVTKAVKRAGSNAFDRLAKHLPSETASYVPKVYRELMKRV